MAFNSVYAGGNAHPYNYYSSHYYMIYDRMRIYADTGDGNGLQLIDYGHSMAMNTDSDTSTPEPPVWDCNAYGLSLIHISEPTRPERISYAVFCLKKKT